jgi:polygalacturonase
LNRSRRIFVHLLLAGSALSIGYLAAQAQPAAHPNDIKLATGSGIDVLPQPKGPFFNIASYGAVSDGPALKNQAAINAAIDAAAKAGGGTVLIPEGTFKTYSIRLKSRVNLHFASKTSILRAAIPGTGDRQDGGFYDAPEVNLFVGIQDAGHSHWANSLIYGIDVTDIMISGPGLIDGSYIDSNGITVNVLSGGDPREPASRTAPGMAAGANKAIALKNSSNIIFRDFHIRNGGHFAILGSGVTNWTIDGIVVDTNRDGIDIDTTQNMTIRNSTFNSVNDDAIVLKGSFGIGHYRDTKNILFEKDIVSGYDPGSVLDGVYSTQRLVASDRDGPTGRVKFGTEGTSGLDTITIRNILFDRSRGFALESVDGATLQNVLFSDIHMKHTSSSPIFIDIGDRGRAPITGIGTGDDVSPAKDLRLNDTGWILPNQPATYGSYPPVRTIPSYNKSQEVNIGGASRPVIIVNPQAPTRLNPYSSRPTDPLSANAVGVGFAQIRNVEIRNVVVEDADPRYPILLNGMVDHPIENVSLTNVVVEYRGGLTMRDAVDQRQITSNYASTPNGATAANQSIPWLVNPFFSKNEALLPRVSWDPSLDGNKGGWANDPYNIPEMTREYPEPSMLGILPAYGMYARHIQGLTLRDVTLKYRLEDQRPAVVLDDATAVRFTGVNVVTAAGVPAIVSVKDTKKRSPDQEYVAGLPYTTTEVKGLVVSPALHMEAVNVDRPSPGTPPDTLYTYPTAPSTNHPYSYAIADDKYPLPLTVHRPSFDWFGPQKIAAGQLLQFQVIARTPAPSAKLAYSAANLPSGATFDAASRTFSWTPTARQAGTYSVKFTVDDTVLPETTIATIVVVPAAKP